MSKAAKIAYQMVLHIPKEMGGDNTGSVIIAPFNTTDDQQGWQLWTRNRSDSDAKKAEHQIRGYIEEAINAGCAAALTRAEAAEQRAKVLEAELSACRADAKQSLRQVTFDGQTVWGTYYTEDTR